MNERRQDSGRGGFQLGDKIDGWLVSARGPALVIAPAEAALIAANSAGAKLLGLAQDPEQPVPLDSAMPAIMDLRRAVNRDLRGRGPVTPLVFWTPDGIARLQCHLEVVDAEHGRRLALVEVACEPAPAVARPVANDTVPDVPEPLIPTPFVAQTPKPAGEAPPRDQPAGESTEPTPGRLGQPPPDIAPDHAEPARTHTPREAMQSSGAAMRAERQEARSQQAPVFSVDGERGAKPGPPSTDAASSAPLPSRPATPPPHYTAPPPPHTRSDDETLKAIARQILAGRRGVSKGSDSHGHKPAHAPSQPNGVAAAHERDARSPELVPGHAPVHSPEVLGTPPAAGHLGAPASKAAATHRPARDVLRSAPTDASVTSKIRSDAIAPHKPEKPAPLAMPHHEPTKELTKDPPPVRPDDDTDRSTGGHTRSTRARRLAHELKTPLSAIASAAEIMKDQRLGSIGDDRYLRYAQDIYVSARHALSVIERMLGQPRKGTDEPGQGEFSFTDLDLNALATGLISGLEAMAQEAGLTLASDLAPRLPRVVADATSVRQITLNLLTNALKFTPRGGQVLLVTRIDENGRLTLTVGDTGPGISAEVLAEIARDCDAPATARTQRQRPGGGLGIGLPLARNLASANGASLAISARDGGGTLVTLTFPSSRQVPI